MITTEDQQILNNFRSYNIDRIVNYHNEIKRLFNNEICYINRKQDDKYNSKSDKRNLLDRKNIYLKDYYPQMIITNFLMMFSYLEEYLYLITTHSKLKDELKKRKGSIGRFKGVIKKINKGIITTSTWQFLVDAEIVRNCLLHANGRVDLISRDNDILRLKSLVGSPKSSLDIKGNKIILSSDYLSDFIENIKVFHNKIQ